MFKGNNFGNLFRAPRNFFESPKNVLGTPIRAASILVTSKQNIGFVSKSRLSPLMKTSPLLRKFSEQNEEEEMSTLRSPQFVQYVADMKAAARKRINWSEIEKIHDQAIANGVPSGSFGEGVLIITAAKLKLDKKVEELVNNYKQNYVLDAGMYDSLLQAYIILEDIKGANGIVEEILSKKIPQNNRIFSNRLKLASLKGDDDEVQAIRAEMEKSGQKPSVFTFAALITHAGNGGKFADIENFLSEMREMKIRMNPLIINSVLEAFLSQRQWSTVVDKFQKMKKMARPNVRSYEILLEAAAKLRDSERLDNIVEEMTEQRIYKTRDMDISLADGYQRAGDFDRAWKILEKMQNKNFRAWQVLVQSCAFHQKTEIMEEALKNLGKFEKNPKLWASVVGAFARMGSLSKAAQTMWEIKEKGIVWDGRHRNALINGLKTGDFPDSLTSAVQHLGLSKEKELSQEETQYLEQVLHSLAN